MAAKEEVLAEVEAVEAVYGDDCLVFDSFPPHLHISLKPRTADVSSEQFVEAIIKLQASPQYPKEPPSINLVDCKGLDEQRQKVLMNCIQDKACELSPCLMLIALCEEAVEKLSSMNHPDGDCPLCLYPLVSEDKQIESLPFMKLMSCFHCFHRKCITRWWNWLQNTKETVSTNSVAVTVNPTQNMENEKGTGQKTKEGVGNCPVCRKPFHVKDLEHVLDLISSNTSQLSLEKMDADDDNKILHSEHEIIRREKYEAILKLQEEKSGVIEPKREIVIQPGMFLPQPVAIPSSASTEESAEQQEKEDAVDAASRKQGNGTVSEPSSSRNQRNGRGRSDHRPRSFHSYNSTAKNSRKPAPRQWVRKDNDNGKQQK